MRLIDSSSILGKVDICMDYKLNILEKRIGMNSRPTGMSQQELVNIFLRCQMLPHWKGVKPDIWYGE